jgi:hypothetical protein
MERRNHPPESWWWATADGRCWRLRLVVAPLSPFGLQRGVGAETLRACCGRLRREPPVGGSPSALRGVRQDVAQVLRETAEAWEHDGSAERAVRPILGAVDEPFLARMLLVCMDRVSGAVLCEEVAEDRRYDTWPALVEARLGALGAGGLSRVRDRATALLTRAETGLECQSVPEVLPRIPALVKRSAWAIGGRLRHARRAVSHAQEPVSQGQASPASGAAAQQAQAVGEESAAAVTRWESVHRAARHPRETGSVIGHPWRLVDSTRQTSAAVARPWHAETRALEACIETHRLPVKKQALDQVRKQRAGVSARVDFWWQGVGPDFPHVALTPRWTRGVEAVWLPRMSGQERRSRTRCPRRQATLLQALEAVQDALHTPPLTEPLAPDVLQDWPAWAAAQATALQRASSAVEGRHGSLSQLPHHQRGLPKHRSKVWTVLHHCDGRAADGTTPAARCFRRGVPDLFATVLSNVDDLPRPRKRHQVMTRSGGGHRVSRLKWIPQKPIVNG